MRTVLAVIAGYIAIAIVIAATHTLAFALLGPSFAFRADTPDVTWGWLALSFVLSFIGAVLGGWLAASIGRQRRPVVVLGALLLVLGLGMAVVQSRMTPPAPPDKPIAELSTQEAGMVARQPPWYPWVIPFVGIAGVFAGGSIRLVAAAEQAAAGAARGDG